MFNVPALAALILATATLNGCASSASRNHDTRTTKQIAHEAHANFVNSINSNDLETLMSALTDDIVLMAPNAPRLVGKDAVRAWSKGYLDTFHIHWKKTTLEFVVAGEWAYEQYSYESTDTLKADGSVYRDTGKGLNIYRLEADGKWRVARDAWSSDLPAAGN